MSVAYPPDVIVVPLGASEPQPFPSRRTDLGRTRVADGLLGGLAEGSEDKKALQISG